MPGEPKTFCAGDTVTGNFDVPYGFYEYICEDEKVKYRYMNNFYEEQDKNNSYLEHYYTLDKLLEYGLNENAEFKNLPKE